MKRYRIAFTTLCFALILQAFFGSISVNAGDFWKNDFSEIDSLAKAIKAEANLEKLVSTLTSHCQNDLEKYRSLFTWVAHNVSYDVDALNNPTLSEADPESVLKNGKAVCGGYSNLFQRMCELAKLECVTISGWTKKKDRIGEPLGSTTSHAWNAIKVKNTWYLCDVTWASGSVVNSNKSFNFSFKDFYFCTPAELFSYDHFPKDEQWLLDSKITEDTFVNRPHFYPGAIDLGLRSLDPDKGTLTYKENEVVKFRFALKGSVKRIVVQLSNTKEAEVVDFSVRDGFIEFSYVMKSYSPYLNIFMDEKGFLVYKVSK